MRRKRSRCWRLGNFEYVVCRTVFALSSLIELALEADDLRHGRTLEREENLVGLGIHTLDLAFVVVIVRHLAAD